MRLGEWTKKMGNFQTKRRKNGQNWVVYKTITMAKVEGIPT